METADATTAVTGTCSTTAGEADVMTGVQTVTVITEVKTELATTMTCAKWNASRALRAHRLLRASPKSPHLILLTFHPCLFASAG